MLRSPKSEVDEVVERLRKASSPWVDPTEARKPRRAIKSRSISRCDEGEEQFQDPIEDAQFIIGESNLFDELREAVLTLKPGETAEAMISFAEDDEAAAEKLRGKTLNYTVTLKGHQGARAPRRSTTNSPRPTRARSTLEELTRGDPQRPASGQDERDAHRGAERIIDSGRRGREIEIPAVMVDDAVTEEIGRIRQRLQMQRGSLEAYLRAQGQTEEEFREEIRPDVASGCATRSSCARSLIARASPSRTTRSIRRSRTSSPARPTRIRCARSTALIATCARSSATRCTTSASPTS